MAGEKNAYYCNTCGGYIVTIDRDDGVTPVFLLCRAPREDGVEPCRGTMRSMMYPDEPWPASDGFDNPIPTEPTWEWFKPTLRAARRGGPEMLDHVQKGGLELRKIDGSTQPTSS